MWSISSNIGARVYRGVSEARPRDRLAGRGAGAVVRPVPLEPRRVRGLDLGRWLGRRTPCAIAGSLRLLDRVGRGALRLDSHELLDLAPVERLVREQRGGELVQDLAVLRDQAARLELSLVDQPLQLLV